MIGLAEPLKCEREMILSAVAVPAHDIVLQTRRRLNVDLGIMEREDVPAVRIASGKHRFTVTDSTNAAEVCGRRVVCAPSLQRHGTSEIAERRLTIAAGIHRVGA